MDHARTMSFGNVSLLAVLMFFLAACGGGGGASSSGFRITSQPESVTLYEGEVIELSVATNKTSGVIYQWYRNGTSLSSERSATLRINSAKLTDAGNYHVTARYFGDTLTSGTAAVVVLEPEVPPYITAQPASIERAAGDLIRLTVTAGGLSPLTYQWFKDGALIPGATNRIYQIASADYEDAGAYRVEVTNSLGFVVSDEVDVTVVRQRATGLWSGTVGDSQADMIVPPSGEMLMIRFKGASQVSGAYRGQINTREGRWWMPRADGQAIIAGLESTAFYQLAVNDATGSNLTPRLSMSGTLRLFEAPEDVIPALNHSLSLSYLTALSQRVTPINSLAGHWRFLNDLSEVLISITLNENGVIVGDSYVYEPCAVTGSLQPVPDSTAFYSVTLNYANRPPFGCGVNGLVEKGYALIRSEEGPMLAWYLYSEEDGEMDGFFYIPTRQ
jgi:hypothetical protein